MTSDYASVVSTSAGDLRLRASGHSDVGLVRQVNEDSIFVRSPLFLVADGMGGHAYGDRASQTVVAVMDETFAAPAPTHPAFVLDAIDEANRRVQALVTEADGPDTVAGTTLSGVALVEVELEPGAVPVPHWMIFNVGDSRVYGWNGREVVQVTVDHSAVQELVSLGLITAEEALVHPKRNVITRAVGSEPHVNTDLWLMPVQGRQMFIACSDGLTKELGDREIGEVVAQVTAEAVEHGDEMPDPSELSQRLVAAAIAHGGRDNVSVVVLESLAGAVEAPSA